MSDLEVIEKDSIRVDKVTQNYIYRMCMKCRFYDNGCTKKRIIRVCAEKGLKNKD